MQDFTAPNTNYPINHFYEDWAQWLGEEATEVFKQYGYCSIPFKLADGTVLENSKVIAINTQASNPENWYLPGFKYDPGNHIAWLEQELAQIEKDGGFAYIIGHAKPADYTY